MTVIILALLLGLLQRAVGVNMTKDPVMELVMFCHFVAGGFFALIMGAARAKLNN